MPLSLACQFARCSQQCPLFQGDAWRAVQKSLAAYVLDGAGPLLHFNRQVSDWVSALGSAGDRDNGLAIVRIFDAFSRSAKCPPEDLLNMMVAEAVSELPNMTPSNVARLTKAIGNLAVDPGNVFFAALDRRVQRAAPRFRPIDARQLLQGLAMLDAVQQNLHCEDRYPIARTYQLLMKHPVFAPSCREGTDIGQMNLLADVERWFTGDSTILYHRQSEERRSDFERQVARALRQSGTQIMPRLDDTNLNHAPDIHGIYKGVELHIECDGPTHMIEACDGSQTYLNGQTVLQTGLLAKALNGAIVRVPISTFERNRTRPYFWSSLLRHVVAHKDDAIFLSGALTPRFEPFAVKTPLKALEIAA